MVSLFLVTVLTSKAMQAVPVETPLPDTFRSEIALLRREKKSLFAALQESVPIPNGAIPPTDLMNAFRSDWEISDRSVICEARSSFPELPHYKLERTHDVIYSARRLLLFSPLSQTGNTFATVGDESELPKAMRDTFIHSVYGFFGFDAPEDPLSVRVKMGVSPKVAVHDPVTGFTRNYELKEAPATSSLAVQLAPNRSGLPVQIQRDRSLEIARAKSVRAISAGLEKGVIDPKAGIYHLGDLVAIVSAKSGVPFVVDRRFVNRRVLVITAKPMSSDDFLLATLTAADLYVRRDLGLNYIGTSPADPRVLEFEKMQVERHNYGADIVEVLFACRSIPSFLPPDVFMKSNAPELWSDSLKQSVLAYLAQQYPEDRQKLEVFAGRIGRLQLSGSVQMDNVVYSDRSNYSAGDSFP